jgi:hypothetical protein
MRKLEKAVPIATIVAKTTDHRRGAASSPPKVTRVMSGAMIARALADV